MAFTTDMVMCLPGGTQMPGNVRRWAARRVSNTWPSLASRINAQPTSTPRSLVDSDSCEINEGVSEWIGQNAGLCNSNRNIFTPWNNQCCFCSCHFQLWSNSWLIHVVSPGYARSPLGLLQKSPAQITVAQWTATKNTEKTIHFFTKWIWSVYSHAPEIFW